MSEAPERSSIQSLLHINDDVLTPDVQEAFREIDRLVTAQSAQAQPGVVSSVDPALAEALAVLAQLAPLRIQAQVQPSSLPIIGGVLTRLKTALHQLILFYLNDLAAQQSAFNHQLLKVLQRLAHQPTRQ